ncbi:MAG TPA: hypothetical protein VFA17_09375 [Thermoplasmata archaeon]|nr:hypothetical protein [Thermoplasmata archaeon]
MPSATGLRVFDAETQETSYGIWTIDGLPYIFDTHRSQGRFVATIELLTEVVRPIRLGRERVLRFCRDAQRSGLLPIPYSGCFFRGNLHVYGLAGPVRGFDLAALGRTATDSERTLRRRLGTLWPRIPEALRRAQQDLFDGRRPARYPADLEVLRRHKNMPAARHGSPSRKPWAREPSRL